jgi:hypothetical protein
LKIKASFKNKNELTKIEIQNMNEERRGQCWGKNNNKAAHFAFPDIIRLTTNSEHPAAEQFL